MKNQKISRPTFTDAVTSACLSIESDWREKNLTSHSIECQTDSNLYQFADMDVQTGQATEIHQEFVPEEYGAFFSIYKLIVF